jgi:hypothetical protein
VSSTTPGQILSNSITNRPLGPSLDPVHARNKSRQPLWAAALNPSFDLEFLFLDLVYAVAGLGLRGLDLEAVLLGGDREETAHAVGLPIRGLLGVDEQMHLGRRMSRYISASSILITRCVVRHSNWRLRTKSSVRIVSFTGMRTAACDIEASPLSQIAKTRPETYDST